MGQYKYPLGRSDAPTDPFTIAERSDIMRRVKSNNTSPELRLRRALWNQGLRYRLNVRSLPGKPDLVFRKAMVVVFVDGEFWHGKKLSPERLSAMKPYWQKKIRRNVERDIEVNRTLFDMGWTIVRVGERTVNKWTDSTTQMIIRILRGDEPGRLPEGATFIPQDQGVMSDG